MYMHNAVVADVIYLCSIIFAPNAPARLLTRAKTGFAKMQLYTNCARDYTLRSYESDLISFLYSCGT